MHLALSEEFANDQIKQTQWIAFLKRSGVSGAPDNFPVAVEKLREFLETPLQTVKEKDAFECIWPAGGPWQKRRQSRQ